MPLLHPEAQNFLDVVSKRIAAPTGNQTPVIQHVTLY
jgi:hypothetical protein